MATAKRGAGIPELLSMHDKARSLACSDFLDKTMDMSDGHAVAACYGKCCLDHNFPAPYQYRRPSLKNRGDIMLPIQSPSLPCMAPMYRVKDIFSRTFLNH